MLFWKKLVFKWMELGLGLRPYFTLQTRNPVFVNFRLSAAEANAVQGALPPGFTLEPLRFVESDPEPALWLSINVYDLQYPRPEMASIQKARCEINTFVSDPDGRLGVFVFCGSPFVSRRRGDSVMERVADFAERLVAFLYGCGRLIRLEYGLTRERLAIDFDEPEAALSLSAPLSADAPSQARLSDDYHRFNDVSFFRGGRTFDLVTTGSSFARARLQECDRGALAHATARAPFFQRAPDRVYVHRGEIAYVVSALHGRG